MIKEEKSCYTYFAIKEDLLIYVVYKKELFITFTGKDNTK